MLQYIDTVYCNILQAHPALAPSALFAAGIFVGTVRADPETSC